MVKSEKNYIKVMARSVEEVCDGFRLKDTNLIPGSRDIVISRSSTIYFLMQCFFVSTRFICDFHLRHFIRNTLLFKQY